MAQRALRYRQVYRSARTYGRSSFINTQEDMDWLREVHLPQLSLVYKSAVIVGTDDCPEEIHCYTSESPMVFDQPDVFVLADEEMPWCEPCKSYHVKPTDVQHHAVLKCRAPFLTMLRPGIV